ncbi:hypothetical protein H112_02453 [Trichophyton rubrum D6]|uniref:Uncharacterized protein n=3 Tax=Trichophyton TaxID=5550 RepID=A0A080WPH2_TRIRC|nr:uncharacterized protein TERG_12382 [Trichophyton rubrum CBS 118892]EZF25184.1 hypothetical protein H100_02454 [Trichophyton rubrum MR850]EZF44223.1 hypothetical protein H102_02450 [Trichophyton rubrum CBS 100081]EZF54882.1 hypothetical protein H103_02463 [Trichophyton rubrum CBS 288.86]EZF65484.1 hypothetical protein H104_02439 [Trichophyton rubrum CBS 289.86]EZF76127.1 hypothetical protein H105_02471 [Trichophyton soudanense CBS 452.61]EZF86772.1 hypothetical protein H110_02457 [Trichophy
MNGNQDSVTNGVWGRNTISVIGGSSQNEKNIITKCIIGQSFLSVRQYFSKPEVLPPTVMSFGIFSSFIRAVLGIQQSLMTRNFLNLSNVLKSLMIRQPLVYSSQRRIAIVFILTRFQHNQLALSLRTYLCHLLESREVQFAHGLIGWFVQI